MYYCNLLKCEKCWMGLSIHYDLVFFSYWQDWENWEMAYWFRNQKSWEEGCHGVKEACWNRCYLEWSGHRNKQHPNVSVVEHRTEHSVEIPKYFIYRPVESNCWICDYHENKWLKEYVWNFNNNLQRSKHEIDQFYDHCDILFLLIIIVTSLKLFKYNSLLLLNIFIPVLMSKSMKSTFLQTVLCIQRCAQ